MSQSSSNSAEMQVASDVMSNVERVDVEELQDYLALHQGVSSRESGIEPLLLM